MSSSLSCCLNHAGTRCINTSVAPRWPWVQAPGPPLSGSGTSMLLCAEWMGTHLCPPDPRHSRGCRGGSTWGTCAFQAHSMMTYPQTVTPAQAAAWEPLLQCCSACVWTPLSSSDKHKETARLHITGCTGTWNKFWAKDTNRPKPTASFEEPGAKACPLHKTPPKGWTQHLSPAPGPGHTLPSPHIKNQLAPTSGSKQAREPITCSHSLLLQRGPQ